MTDLSTEKKKRFFVFKRIDSISPPKDQQKNIFSGESLKFLNVPSIENLQQRQIVGKLEQFLKVQEQSDTTLRQHNRQITFNPIKFAAKRMSIGKSSRVSLFSSSTIHQEPNTKRQRNYDVVSQKDILKLIKQTEERIKSNNEIENELEKPKNNTLIRQTRALNKFSVQQQVWEQQVEELTRKAKKTDHDSVIRKSTQFREKVEQLEHCEAVKYQLEGTGRGNEWYMTLRNAMNNPIQKTQQDQSKERKSVYQEHFNQNTFYVDKSQKPLEIIRSTSQSNSVSKSIFRRNSSLGQINIFKLPLHKTVLNTCEDVSNLQIEGVNVLQREIDQVKFGDPQEQYRFYKIDKEQDQCEL